MDIMLAYSAALIFSCFLMACGALLLTRPLLGMLVGGDAGKHRHGVVVAWVALGFLQVVNIGFAWWVCAVAVSIIVLLVPAWQKSVTHGWLWLMALSLLTMMLVFGLAAPGYLIADTLIIMAASLAGALVARGRRGLPCSYSAAIPLAMCLGYVAYSALIRTI
jgi:hypothetical protein